MNIIKITTDNKITVHEFPEGTFSEQNMELRELIGPECELFKFARPQRLYQELGASDQGGYWPGSGVIMLADEEGSYHDVKINPVGSYLYESDIHGTPIVGNILIIGEHITEDGAEFSGISEEQFQLLHPKLEKLVEDMNRLTPQRRSERHPEPVQKGPKV